MIDKSFSQIAREAADLIDTHGKTEDYFSNNEGKLCIRGAIRKAMGLPLSVNLFDALFGHWTPEDEPIMDKIGAVMGSNAQSIVAWNNDPMTTGAEVSDYLRRAADKMDNANV